MAGKSVKIQENTSEKLYKISRTLGVRKEELVDIALSLYLDNVANYLDLKKEIRKGDALSGVL